MKTFGWLLLVGAVVTAGAAIIPAFFTVLGPSRTLRVMFDEHLSRYWATDESFWHQQLWMRGRVVEPSERFDSVTGEPDSLPIQSVPSRLLNNQVSALERTFP